MEKAGTKPFSTLKLAWMTFGLSLGIFMNVLDSSIANVAVPHIAGDLGVSSDEGTWVITSFTVCLAIMLPLTGWLAKRFGEVKLFLFSTALFTIASLLCGLSSSLKMLIIFRCIQGAVAGPMIPLSQSLLLAHYPEDKQGLATAFWAMTAVVAPIVGPILGGWITYNYTWPWIFYINLPVGILSVYIVWATLHDQETETARLPIDGVGLFLLVIGIGCLQILLDRGQDLDWFNSNVIRTLAVISFVSLTFLVVWELTERYPVIDLHLFKHRNFLIATAALSFGYLLFFSNVVILPLWLQTQMGYTATWAGLATAPVGVFPLFLSPIVGRYGYKIDLRILVSFGFLVFAVTSFWYTRFNTDVSFNQLVLPRFIQGLGVAFFFIPLISISLSGLPVRSFASATGLANFLRILGGSFGTSISVTLWSRREAAHQSKLVENFNPLNPAVVQAIESAHHAGIPAKATFAFYAQVVINQAYMLSTNDFFWLSAWGFALLMLLIWFARPPFFHAKGGAAE